MVRPCLSQRYTAQNYTTWNSRRYRRRRRPCKPRGTISRNGEASHSSLLRIADDSGRVNKCRPILSTIRFDRFIPIRRLTMSKEAKKMDQKKRAKMRFSIFKVRNTIDIGTWAEWYSDGSRPSILSFTDRHLCCCQLNFLNNHFSQWSPSITSRDWVM